MYPISSTPGSPPVSEIGLSQESKRKVSNLFRECGPGYTVGMLPAREN